MLGGVCSWYLEAHHHILAPEGARWVGEFGITYETRWRRSTYLVQRVYKFYSFLWWRLWIFTVEG